MVQTNTKFKIGYRQPPDLRYGTENHRIKDGGTDNHQIKDMVQTTTKLEIG